MSKSQRGSHELELMNKDSLSIMLLFAMSLLLLLLLLLSLLLSQTRWSRRMEREENEKGKEEEEEEEEGAMILGFAMPINHLAAINKWKLLQIGSQNNR